MGNTAGTEARWLFHYKLHPPVAIVSILYLRYTFPLKPLNTSFCFPCITTPELLGSAAGRVVRGSSEADNV